MAESVSVRKAYPIRSSGFERPNVERTAPVSSVSGPLPSLARITAERASEAIAWPLHQRNANPVKVWLECQALVSESNGPVQV